MGAGPGNSCRRFKGTKPSVHCRDQRERVMEGIDSGGYLVSLKMIFFSQLHVETTCKGFIQSRTSPEVVLRTFQRTIQFD